MLQKQTTKMWKVRNWIRLGYIIVILLSIFSTMIAVASSWQVRGDYEKFSERRKFDRLVSDLGINIQILSRTARGYLIARSSISKSSYDAAVQKVESLFEEAKQGAEGQDERDTLEDMEDVVRAIRDIDRDLIDLVDRGLVEEARQQWQQRDTRNLAEEVTDLIAELRALENQQNLQHAAEVERKLRGLGSIVGGVTLASVIIGAIMALQIERKISRQMEASAHTVASYSTQIAATMEEQERSLSHQAASVNQTTTTMDELGSSAQQVTEQAEGAASSARRALDLSESGTQAVTRTLDGMESLRERVGAIADQIVRLSEQTKQIGNISNLVSDLANQTNMLALNATVEAVRAGENGKGFAVVAAEIRKLADRSKQSAERIGTLVGDIQGAIDTTVMVTDEGTKTVEANLQVAQETAAAFQGVSDAVNNVVLNNQQISLSIKQQSIAIQQVLEAMNSINGAAQENSLGISQVKEGTQNLSDAAMQLKEIV